MEGAKKRGKNAKKPEKRENNRHDDVVYTARARKGWETKSPRAYPDGDKTTRRWDIIGRRISKGVSLFPVLCAVDHREDLTESQILSFRGRHPRTTLRSTEISKTRRIEMDTQPPFRFSKWFSKLRQAWDWIWLWWLCRRDRPVTCSRAERRTLAKRGKKGKEFSTFELSQFAKMSCSFPNCRLGRGKQARWSKVTSCERREDEGFVWSHLFRWYLIKCLYRLFSVWFRQSP